MRIVLFIIGTFWFTCCMAQYSFSGHIDKDEWNTTVYLSLVEDYRKLNGVYNEQIISKTEADSTGFFEFKGDMLEHANRIYRIHVDKCKPLQLGTPIFSKECNEIKSLLFIANNNDVIELPFSFENEIFCNIQSTNPKANAIASIDSLKADMRFAYSDYRSEANRKLNNKKWFRTLQDFGSKLNEPLAELYIYSYLSDRTSDLYSYYTKDLGKNRYYDNLLYRLEQNYPDSNYAKQYAAELGADKFIIDSTVDQSTSLKLIVLYIVLFISLSINAIVFFKIWIKKRKKTASLKEQLSNQEAIVLDQILQNKSNKAIAETLFLSVSTIKTHTNNIYKKLGVQSRDEVKSLFSRQLKKST